jgi:hypothetical protein
VYKGPPDVVRHFTVADADLVERRELADAAGISRAMRRIAHEIVERNPSGGVVLVGIRWSASEPPACRWPSGCRS